MPRLSLNKWSKHLSISNTIDMICLSIIVILLYFSFWKNVLWINILIYLLFLTFLFPLELYFLSLETNQRSKIPFLRNKLGSLIQKKKDRTLQLKLEEGRFIASYPKMIYILLSDKFGKPFFFLLFLTFSSFD